METPIEQCRWPSLPEPYAQALREAVAFILEKFDALGIVAAGTVVSGNPGPSSDLDICVINTEQKRQRIQRFFAKVPCEIFVNPVKAIEHNFVSDRKDGRPVTAHMLATGFVVLERDPAVEQLRRCAREMLDTRPNPDTQQLTSFRYGAALTLEDARDVAETRPATATMILCSAIHAMITYFFLKSDRFIPRDNDMLDVLHTIDAGLAVLIQEFYETPNLERRLELAEDIASRTIKAQGFFEWESELEQV